MRYIIGDTETTGLGPDRAACEIGLIEIDPDTLDVLGEMSSIINPGKPIDPKAFAVHGITDERASGFPTLPTYIADTLGGHLDGDLCLIGYRVSFDLPMLRPFGNIVKTFDVLTLAQSLVTGSADHKLQTMKEHFNLAGGAAHSALGDCQTTLELLRILVGMSGRTLRAHCATEFTMIHTLPWGKHSGSPLVALPASYRKWLIGLADLDHNLRKSLEILSKTER